VARRVTLEVEKREMERVEKEKRLRRVICGERKWRCGRCRREELVAINWKFLQREREIMEDQYLVYKRLIFMA